MTSLTELGQLGGTLATVVLFLLYLNKKDDRDEKTYDAFNTTINNHLHDSQIVIKENSKALTKVAVNIKGLSHLIKNNKKKKIEV